jgi:hypothetical protein
MGTFRTEMSRPIRVLMRPTVVESTSLAFVTFSQHWGVPLEGPVSPVGAAKATEARARVAMKNLEGPQG